MFRVSFFYLDVFVVRVVVLVVVVTVDDAGRYPVVTKNKPYNATTDANDSMAFLVRSSVVFFIISVIVAENDEIDPVVVYNCRNKANMTSTFKDTKMTSTTSAVDFSAPLEKYFVRRLCDACSVSIFSFQKELEGISSASCFKSSSSPGVQDEIVESSLGDEE